MSWHPGRRRLTALGAVSACVLISLEGGAQVWRHREPEKPRPDRASLRYGPFERNVLDFWKAPPSADRDRPSPVVVFFHGGGFIGGDKRSVPAWLLERCLARGISVVSANYRLSSQAPYPAPMHDGARVVQFLRFRASELGIDPQRIAACGNSAGGGIALWVGFHDDLADATSPDPVLRQSSRLSCMGVVGAQTSYDPRFIKQLLGGRAHEHVALRSLFAVKSPRDASSPRVLRLYEDSSAINHATADDPPTLLFYSEPDGPLRPGARAGEGIHHPRFGAALKAVMDPLGIECIVRHHDSYRAELNPEQSMYADLVDFFVGHLGARLPPTARGRES